MEAAKGSGWEEAIKRFVTFWYCLKSEKQNCFKAKPRAIGHGQRDRAKKRIKRSSNWEKIEGRGL